MPAVDRRNKNGSESPESNIVKCIFDKILEVELGKPVDFELPDSFRRWKPTDYIAIKRNIYLTKRRIEDDGIFCSCSPSLGSSSVCSGDCHCDCRCGDFCRNKPFQRRALKKLKVVKTEKCGLGLVADEDIRQGDFVVEYIGEVIDDKSCEERLWKMKHRGDTNFYLCEVNHDMVIDATFKGNRSRFINHCCEPNTEMQKRNDGETRVGIFAIRNIRKGEELTYDYQFVQFGADQDCHCGASGCKKKLGNKPSKMNISFSDSNCKDLPNEGSHVVSTDLIFPCQRETCSQNCIGEVVRIWCSRYKRYVGGVIQDFDNYLREHIIAFEDGRVEHLDMSQEDWEFL